MHIVNYDNPPPIEELRLSNLNKEKMDNGRYTWEKKYSVVAIFLQCGSMRETAAKAGMNISTLENWRKLPWWNQLVKDIKETDHTVLNNKLSQILNKALGTVEDRLENGEWVLNNKTGEMVRKPVNLRDATRAASELMQRQHQLNKTTEEVKVTKESVQETLKLLASEFAKLTNKPSTANAVDIEYVEEVDAVYEERKAGL